MSESNWFFLHSLLSNNWLLAILLNHTWVFAEWSEWTHARTKTTQALWKPQVWWEVLLKVNQSQAKHNINKQKKFTLTLSRCTPIKKGTKLKGVQKLCPFLMRKWLSTWSLLSDCSIHKQSKKQWVISLGKKWERCPVWHTVKIIAQRNTKRV